MPSLAKTRVKRYFFSCLNFILGDGNDYFHWAQGDILPQYWGKSVKRGNL
jgi:hypothetical protein